MRKIAFIAAIMILSGCGTVSKSYVDADRKTYDAVSPRYRAYVAADKSLDDTERSRRVRTVDSWLVRIEEGDK